jgi:hypothetical protein
MLRSPLAPVILKERKQSQSEKFFDAGPENAMDEKKEGT